MLEKNARIRIFFAVIFDVLLTLVATVIIGHYIICMCVCFGVSVNTSTGYDLLHFYADTAYAHTRYLMFLFYSQKQEVLGWYKLRRNSSMQVSMREHAVHHSLSRWLRKDEDSPSVLFMLCVSQTTRDAALYTCDHQFMITTDG